MKATFLDSKDRVDAAGGSWLDRAARKMLFRRLARITVGKLTVVDSTQHLEFGAASDEAGLSARIEVRSQQFYSEIAFGGALGAAESFMRGDWVCGDLTALVRVLVVNRSVLEDLDSGTAKLAVPLRKALHWLNRNTRRGSRRNIGAHYDLGNDFFRLWLDERMMYSSAVFEHSDMSLEEASTAKLDRICRKLQLQPDDHVIEIGTGWGGFAIYAARHYGCRVTTTTISAEQFALAKERVVEAGLQDRITLLMQDYRDLEGQFDKLVSIEMIEAVGQQYMSGFFQKCCELLKPQGLMCLQTITIADQRYEKAARSVDFIQRYIFPGGCLPSLTMLASTMTAHTDMRVTHVEDFGSHYARTLQVWRERFFERLGEVRELGYSEEFVRMWHYYLCYCEGAFLERAIGVVQMVIGRPLARREPITGALT